MTSLLGKMKITYYLTIISVCLCNSFSRQVSCFSIPSSLLVNLKGRSSSFTAYYLSSADQGNSDGFIQKQQDKKLQEFLNGEGTKAAWKGSTESLKRRRQVPSSEYDPQTVVSKCLQALQANDDPQLDHGCCVLLAFKSPHGTLAQGGLDPAGLGRFLRSTNYELLLDNADFDFLGDPFPSPENSLSVRQTVQIKGWDSRGGAAERRNFDFYLTKYNDLWLVDIVLACDPR